MKQLLFILIFYIGLSAASAQDTLYRVNGKVQAVKIVEISNAQVKFRNPNGQSGPLFVLSKSEISKIVYENGKIENISTERRTDYEANSTIWKERTEEDKLHTNFNRRMVELNLPDYFSGSLTLAYQYFTKTGDYSLRIPVSIGLYGIGLNKYGVLEGVDGRQGYYRERKKFSTGFDCNYFPNGQGKVRYYVGPSVEFGWFNYSDDLRQNVYPYARTIETSSGSFQSVILQNGFLFQPTQNLNFSLNIGLGYTRERYLHSDINNQYPEDFYAENRNLFAFRAGMCIGYRF